MKFGFSKHAVHYMSTGPSDLSTRFYKNPHISAWTENRAIWKQLHQLSVKWFLGRRRQMVPGGLGQDEMCWVTQGHSCTERSPSLPKEARKAKSSSCLKWSSACTESLSHPVEEDRGPRSSLHLTRSMWTPRPRISPPAALSQADGRVGRNVQVTEGKLTWPARLMSSVMYGRS